MREDRLRLRDARRRAREEKKAFVDAVYTLAKRLYEDLRVALLHDDVRSASKLATQLDLADLAPVKPLPQWAVRFAMRGEGAEITVGKVGLKREALKLLVLESIGFKCPRCHKVKLNHRQWHVGKHTMCIACRMTKKPPGRARQGEPPVDSLCPACGKIRKRRRQWDLKNGICKRCSALRSNGPDP